MSQVSIYQIVMVQDGRALNLPAHLDLIFDAFYQIFHSGVRLPIVEIGVQIDTLLRANDLDRKGQTAYIRLEVDAVAQISLSLEARSIYQGYSLRCISPRAISVSYDIPYINYPTTARDVVTELVNLKAQRAGADMALHSIEGVVDVANGAQLFAVKGLTLITSEKSHSVEHNLALAAALKLDIAVEYGPIRESDLQELDELFYADHYGITALSYCNGRRCMSIVAARVAQLMKNESL